MVMPSWVGDAIMATPALRLVRSAMPGAFIGGLVRPGIDEVLAGTDLLDELHVERTGGVMGPKRAAAGLRSRRYDAALILANSFSSALITRLAFIPRRVGYARDARSLLLTERLTTPKRPDGRWALIPALTYYWNAACAFTRDTPSGRNAEPAPWDLLPPAARLELRTTADEEEAADELLARAGLAPDTPTAILNPGGNNPAKRWPPDRFARVARHLREHHGLTTLLSGSPAEADLAEYIAAESGANHSARVAIALPRLGLRLGAVKALVRRSRIMVTNDTGPRHIAAAFGVPVATLFGPTDPRWTTIPAPGGEAVIVADPTLPADQVCDDHPERCRIERIAPEEVIAAANRLLDARRP